MGLLIFPTIEKCELAIFTKPMGLITNTENNIDENQPTEKIIEEISNLIKKYTIEKSCKEKNGRI